jgi:signal transduction histidine kinase
VCRLVRRIRETKERLLQGSGLRAQFVKDVLMGDGQPADFGCGRTADLDTAVIGEHCGDPCRRQESAELLRFLGSDPDDGLCIALDEFRGARVGEQSALVDHDQVIRGHSHLSHQVTRHEHCPSLGGQSPQELAEPVDALGVETIGRFVEHQSRRVAEQCNGEAQTLAHAQGEFTHPPVAHARQLDQLKHLADPASIDRRGDIALAAVLTAAGVSELLLEANPAPPIRTAPLILLATVPIIWRRRWPLLVIAIVFIGVAISRETPYVDSICAAVAAYAVGTHEKRRIAGLVELAVLGMVVIAGFGGVLPSIPTFIAPFAVLFAFWTVGALVRQGRAKADAMAERAHRLETEQRLLLAVAKAEERARIARELHDVVAHSVSLMVVQAGAARQVVERTPDRAIGALEAVGETGRQAMQELRTILGVLGDGGGDRDPQPTLADVGAIVGTIKDAGLPVSLVVRGTARVLAAGLELTGYRVVQEALTNALKHSRLSPTQVVIEYRPQEVVLEILCDGPANSPGSNTGRGIAGMKERVAIVGGRLEAGPGVERGFNVRAWLPIDQNSKSESTA